MQIKSWQIAFGGILTNFLTIYLPIGSEGAIYTIFVLFLSIPLIIFSLLLRSNNKKIKIISAAMTIIFGIFFLFGGIKIFSSFPEQLLWYYTPEWVRKMSLLPGLMIPVTVFLLWAGILYFKIKINSWYIASLGIIFQVISWILFMFSRDTMEESIKPVLYNLHPLYLLSATLGIIPTLFLYLHKTRKFGALMSIIFSISGLATVIVFLNIDIPQCIGDLRCNPACCIASSTYYGMLTFVSGSFLIIAGILHLREKI